MQVDPTTKRRVRGIVSGASSSGELQRLDVVAAEAAGVRSVIVSDVSFRFMDGDFVYVGRDFEAYSKFHTGGLTFVRRDIATGEMPVRHAHPLSSKTATFATIPTGQFDGSFDCYLLPIPRNLSPIVIASALPDVYLVAGIDFTCHDGFIALRESPAEVLPVGVVRVITAELYMEPYNSYVMAAPDIRRGNRRIADYFRKSQSIRSFRLAAAQYCGLYVFDHADLVTQVHEDGRSMTYITARAGVVRISYPHVKLSAGQRVPSGFVISRRFEFIEYRERGPGMLQAATQYSGAAVSLDFVNPVVGVSWAPETTVVASYVETGYGGRPHARLQLDGHDYTLQAFWDAQKHHELATGQYLSDVLGLTAQNPTVEVDMGLLLESFYGNRLALFVADELPSEMQRRLQEFLREHRPAVCALLCSFIPVEVSDITDETIYLGQLSFDGAGFIYNTGTFSYN